MISSIQKGNLRKGEFSQFLVDILKVIEQNDAGLLKVQAEYDALLAISRNIDPFIKKQTGNSITTLLEALDLRRNNEFISIREVLRGYTHSSDKTLHTSALLLKDHMEFICNDVYRDNYQSKTAKIGKLLKDWETTPRLAAALTQLNLDASATALKTANDLFHRQYLERAYETGSARPKITLKQVRLQANSAYERLILQLNAEYTVNNGADPFGNTVRTINALLKSYRSLIVRGKRNDKSTLNGLQAHVA